MLGRRDFFVSIFTVVFFGNLKIPVTKEVYQNYFYFTILEKNYFIIYTIYIHLNHPILYKFCAKSINKIKRNFKT